MVAGFKMFFVNNRNFFKFSLNTLRIYIVEAGDDGRANYIDEIA